MSKENKGFLKGFLKGFFSKKSSCCSFEIEENDNKNQAHTDKEENKVEQNDDSSGCCSDLNVCDIRCSPKNNQNNSGCKPGDGCC